jgi:hypothetical protein
VLAKEKKRYAMDTGQLVFVVPIFEMRNGQLVFVVSIFKMRNRIGHLLFVVPIFKMCNGQPFLIQGSGTRHLLTLPPPLSF